VLISSYETDNLPVETDVPDKLLDSFGRCCLEAGLIDELGNFNDPYKLVRFFVQSPEKKGKKVK